MHTRGRARSYPEQWRCSGGASGRLGPAVQVDCRSSPCPHLRPCVLPTGRGLQRRRAGGEPGGVGAAASAGRRQRQRPAARRAPRQRAGDADGHPAPRSGVPRPACDAVDVVLLKVNIPRFNPDLGFSPKTPDLIPTTAVVPMLTSEAYVSHHFIPRKLQDVSLNIRVCNAAMSRDLACPGRIVRTPPF